MIVARSMADLLDKVYAAEGWTRVAGESKTARAKTTYNLAIDYKRNRFTATKKYAIRRLPACQELDGTPVPAAWGVSIIVNGQSWDGGEYPTREEAVAAGEAGKIVR